MFNQNSGTMKKILVIVLISLCFLPGKGMAQIFDPEVICSGEHAYQDGDFSWNGTLGDVFTETLVDAECLVTQGFHQPEKGTLSVKELPSDESYSVLPNPVKDWFILFTDARNHPELRSLRIFNIQGMVQWEKKQVFPGSPLRIPGLPEGIYILEFRSEQNEQHKIKFIKQ